MPAQKIFFTSRIRLMTCNYLLVSNVLYADISQRHGRVKFRREHETLSRDFAVVNLELYRRGEVTRMIFACWLEYIHIYRGTYRVVCSGRKRPAIHGITCSRVVIATLHKHGLASCRRGTKRNPFTSPIVIRPCRWTSTLNIRYVYDLSRVKKCVEYRRPLNF